MFVIVLELASETEVQLENGVTWRYRVVDRLLLREENIGDCACFIIGRKAARASDCQEWLNTRVLGCFRQDHQGTDRAHATWKVPHSSDVKTKTLKPPLDLTASSESLSIPFCIHIHYTIFKYSIMAPIDAPSPYPAMPPPNNKRPRQSASNGNSASNTAAIGGAGTGGAGPSRSKRKKLDDGPVAGETGTVRGSGGGVGAGSARARARQGDVGDKEDEGELAEGEIVTKVSHTQ